MQRTDTFLELRVNEFRLALHTECVLAVVDNLRVDTPVGGEEHSVCDLAPLFGGEVRKEVPFAVIVEIAGQRAVIGVDAAMHLRESLTIAPLPIFGLLHPELFDGVLRDPEGLLLVLSPSALIATCAK